MVTEEHEQAGVKIKGFGDGLKLSIPSEHDFHLLKPDLEKQFVKLKKLAVNARVFVETDQGDPDQELVIKISDYLKSEFNTGDVTAGQAKKSSGFERARNRDASRGWNNRESDILIKKV